jgi:hypothetical protein
MHHIHPIAAQSIAAAEYKAYLDRLQATNLAAQQEKLRKKSRMQTFESYVNRDRNPGGNPHQSPGQNQEQEEPQSESDADPEGGFGKHYA